ncbi:MAG: 50S ribosomal protein L9 [Firmicutes bacterium]|nr:50S ribosomal protein L9 [Bacillota bacterium]
MEVVLLREVPGLGRKGEVVRVAEGYARNYLLPRGLAEPLTPGKKKALEAERETSLKREERLLRRAREAASRLEGRTVRVGVRMGSTGKPFGSVGTRDIAEAVAQQLGLNLDRKQIVLREPIRTTGTFEVTARLHAEVHVQFTVEVVAI